MQICLPFSDIEKILNIHKILEGDLVGTSINSKKSELTFPVIYPSPIPNLLDNPGIIDISRPKLENVWDTKTEESGFPTTKHDIKCWYCSIKLFKYLDDTDHITRWFLPTRRDKKTYIANNGITENIHYIYGGEGIFCTYYCCYLQIISTKQGEQLYKYMKLLNLMYFDLYKTKPQTIIDIIVKEHMEEYGGQLTENNYKVHAHSYTQNK